MMRCTPGILFLLSLISIHISAQITSQPPAQAIPEFQFVQFNNSPFTNQNLPKGKVIFFMFFDPDCDHCHQAIKSIGENLQSFKKIAIFLISVDDERKINQFMDTYGSQLKGLKNVTILQDKLQQFIVKFNPVRYPSMFLYSPEKKLLDYEDNPESLFRLVNVINKNVQ
jgi:peroxiredoxin